jgi:hypothetical protein
LLLPFFPAKKDFLIFNFSKRYSRPYSILFFHYEGNIGGKVEIISGTVNGTEGLLK